MSAYKSYNTKVIIICPEHGSFEQIPKNHLQGKSCSKCGKIKCSKARTKTTKWFIKQAKKIHNNKYNYSLTVYKNTITKITIICPNHGEFKQTPNGHLQGRGCPKCGGSKLLTTEECIKQFKQVHGNKYDYSLVKYKNAKSKINVICLLHGTWLIKPTNHLSGYGCPDCGGSKPLDKKTFVFRAKKIHGTKYNYKLVKYINLHSKVTILCKLHGVFKQRPMAHVNLAQGCPKCNYTISKPEAEWLDSLNIPKNYRNKTIKVNNKRFNVDGFDPKTNTVYEFNGDYWHGNPKKFNPDDINPRTKTTYGILYKKTIEKQKFLEKNGYTVVSIWESEWKTKRKGLK